jgi:hypothetical protein
MKKKTNDETPEEILRRKFDETEELGRKISDFGREVITEGQKIIDQANATRNIVSQLPPDYPRENLIIDFDQINQAYGYALAQLNLSKEPLIAASGLSSTAYVNTTSNLSMEHFSTFIPPEQLPPIAEAVTHLINIVSLPNSRDDVLSIIAYLQLDATPRGKKRPSEQITIAFNAFEQPVTDTNPVSTSLLPMRESIETIISELLRRRPTQEKAGNDYQKIISIGMQLRRAKVVDALVHTWADQFVSITNELSGTKRADITRDEWAQRLKRAILFLDGFLKGLDPVKVRIQ